MGVGQNETTRKAAGCSPSFHLPGFDFGYIYISSLWNDMLPIPFALACKQEFCGDASDLTKAMLLMGNFQSGAGLVANVGWRFFSGCWCKVWLGFL